MQPRILLAWESGDGRGHISTLKTVAESLGEAFSYDASLCLMKHAAELESVCHLVFHGSGLSYDDSLRNGPNAAVTATWGESLGDFGFRNKDFLIGEVGWWQENLRRRRISLVVADYAPCAMMAAQSMGIPVVITGTGYGIPPIGLSEFPYFLPEHTTRLYNEEQMLDTVNQAVVPLGVPRLERLSDIYRREGELVRTLDILDPYAGLRDQPLLAPDTPVSTVISSGEGDEIFAYLSVLREEDVYLVTALARLKVPRRIFCSGLQPELVNELEAGGVIIETLPVPVDLIATRSRLILNVGQHGILSLGLAAGIPQVALPQYHEQLYHARRVEAQGVAKIVPHHMRDVNELRTFIQTAYNDETMSQNARALAHKLRPVFAQDTASIIRERVLPLLG